jgi:hypothetical protein
MKKTLRMSDRVKRIEQHQAEVENAPPDYSEYSPEEQAFMKKAEEVSEKLRGLSDSDDRFGVLQATLEDRKALVEAALIFEKHMEKQVLEVK